jgi:hypothetical protein
MPVTAGRWQMKKVVSPQTLPSPRLSTQWRPGWLSKSLWACLVSCRIWFCQISCFSYQKVFQFPKINLTVKNNETIFITKPQKPVWHGVLVINSFLSLVFFWLSPERPPVSRWNWKLRTSPLWGSLVSDLTDSCLTPSRPPLPACF